MGKQARAMTLAIESYLSLTGFMVVKPGSACARNAKGDFYRIGQPGVSDIIAWKPRRTGGAHLLMIEVKATKNEAVSPKQSAFLIKAQAYGAICIVARSCEDVEKIVSELAC